jgi:hypothetical protein
MGVKGSFWYREDLNTKISRIMFVNPRHLVREPFFGIIYVPLVSEDDMTSLTHDEPSSYPYS